VQKLTPKKVLTDLVAIYREINLLSEDTKALIAEAKEVLPEDVDVAAINKLAKLIALAKEGEAVEKMKSFIELTEELA
jgi:hypothetical protein